MSLNKQQIIHHILHIEALIKTLVDCCPTFAHKRDLVASHGHHAVSSYSHNFSMNTNRTSVHEEWKTFNTEMSYKTRELYTVLNVRTDCNIRNEGRRRDRYHGVSSPNDTNRSTHTPASSTTKSPSPGLEHNKPCCVWFRN